MCRAFGIVVDCACLCMLPDVVVGCCLLLRVGVDRCRCSLLVVVVCCCGLLCAVSCVRLLLLCYVCVCCVSCLYAGTGRCYFVLCGVRCFSVN